LVSLVCTYLLPETNGTALRSIQGASDASVASELKLPGSGR